MCVACSSCTVVFFVFFFMIMIKEYRACFYSTLCLKVSAYFQNVFELNTAEHKLLGFSIPHLEADSGKANRHSFHVFLDYDNDKTVSCMFYPTLCLKMGAYFNDVFELNTATALGGRFDLIKPERKFEYMHLVR